jgi:hypothetical protein
MEDRYEAADTEIEIESNESEPKGPSIREALAQHLDQGEQPDTEVKAETETQDEVTQETPHVETPIDRPTLLPPADMRAEEREAFLNPTAANAHVLQGYLNRRAYETRSDYSRKMAEVEELKRQTSGIYDVIKQYETDYAKQGISLGDIAKRSIAWDKAMQNNPVETAIEWLESYGLTIDDIAGYQPQNGDYQPQQNPGYLTRQEAERIAEERMQAIMQQQEQKAVELFNQRVVESFMNTKPVFKDPETASQIEAEMAPIVQALTGTGRYSSPEQILETAYNYVINGNPAYSSLVHKMTAKPVIEQQQAVAQKAKAASRSISGSPGSGTPRIQTKDLRENLRRRLIGDD